MKALPRYPSFISLISILVALATCHGGIVDTNFNPGVGTDFFGLSAWVWEIVLQPDGKIIATIADNSTRLARLASDGSLDASFVSSVHPLPPWSSLGNPPRLLQPDGKLVLWVNASDTPESDFSPALVRLNRDGSLDPQFQSFLFSANYTMLFQRPDGRLIVSRSIGSGSASADGPLSDVVELYELHPNGRLNTGFNVRLLRHPPTRDTPITWPTDGALQDDGKLLLLGDLRVAGNEQYQSLVRLHPDGTPDTSFRPDPEWVAQFGVSKILVQPDGRILLNGLRLLSNGSYDASFEPGPLSGEPLLVQSDGRILMSESHCCPNQTILLRLLPSGAEDQSFPRILANGPISSLVPQPDGKTLVAGQFTEIDGARRPGLARLNTEPRLQFEGVRRDSAGNVKLTLGVQAGSRVVLEASDDLANWVALRTNAATSLTLELEDTDAANYSQHFYRARLAP